MEARTDEEFHRLLCQPVVNFLVGSGEYNWQPLQKLAHQGRQSETWQVCLEGDDCEYVLKYIAFKNKDGSDAKVFNIYMRKLLASEAFENEIRIQELCSVNNVCPNIIEAWTCEKGGVVIMERLDENIAELFDKYKSDHVRYMIAAASLGILNKLHSIGVAHGDVHGGNIMVKFNPMTEKEINMTFMIPRSEFTEADEYYIQRYKYYVIDMGRSIITDNREIYISDFGEIKRLFRKSGREYENLTDMVGAFIESAK